MCISGTIDMQHTGSMCGGSTEDWEGIFNFQPYCDSCHKSGGEIENSFFLEYINVSQGKNYIAFLILHEATCMQK